MKPYTRSFLRDNIVFFKLKTVFIYFLATVVLFIPLFALHGDNGTIADIQGQYNKLKKEINQLHHDRLVINQENKPWPSSGSYQETYDIYYKLAEVWGDVPRLKTILFIQVQGNVDYKPFKSEELFDVNGKLIFYYNNYLDGEKDKYVERRFYFSGGTLIRYCEDATIFEQNLDSHIHKSDVDDMLKRAQDRLRFFEQL